MRVQHVDVVERGDDEQRLVRGERHAERVRVLEDVSGAVDALVERAAHERDLLGGLGEDVEVRVLLGVEHALGYVGVGDGQQALETRRTQRVVEERRRVTAVAAAAATASTASATAVHKNDALVGAQRAEARVIRKSDSIREKK